MLRKYYSGSQDEMDLFPGARALLNEVQMDITLSPEEALDHLLGAPIDRFGYMCSGRFLPVDHRSPPGGFQYQIPGFGRCCFRPCDE